MFLLIAFDWNEIETWGTLKCPPCPLCPHASNDMQHDLVRSPFDLDLRSKSEVGLSRSSYIRPVPAPSTGLG